MKGNDVIIIIRGLQIVIKACTSYQQNILKRTWTTSSLRPFVEQKIDIDGLLKSAASGELNEKTKRVASEVTERTAIVVDGIKHYVSIVGQLSEKDYDVSHQLLESEAGNEKQDSAPSEVPQIPEVVNKNEPDENVLETTKSNSPPRLTQRTVPVSKQRLNELARESKVPSSRIGRLVSYGSLAAGLGFGALAEVTKRSLGIKQKKSDRITILDDNPFLTDANANRIVDTLCRVRGAALKFGQMLSIQDNHMINPQLQAVFERVRQSADFMPFWQVEKVLIQEFGPNWRDKFGSFEAKPFAAASIGQVHHATLHEGTAVAMKIQYPGVAESIESDIKNLLSVMTIWDILPKGLFLENLSIVAQRELAWEVDYVREAECAKRFKELASSYPEFYVPSLIDEFCTKQVLTAELIFGTPVDQLVDAKQDLKNEICRCLVNLSLMELFQFGFMQTDPNWSNFFYMPETDQIALLDFGACRTYDKKFVDKYMMIIKAASERNKSNVMKFSKNIGFLTGYESKEMEEAHLNAVMILGEAFAYNGEFDFGCQSTTKRIHSLVPVMLRDRLTPPPEETYSLHRKLSGVFLLCTKLQAKINCKNLFDEIYANYKFDADQS